MRVTNLDTTANNFSAIRFSTKDSGAAAASPAAVGAQFVNHTSGSVTGDLFFVTQNAGTQAEKMRILANGNVGIGTVAPSALLEVKSGNVSGTDLRITNIDTGGSSFTLKSTGSSSTPGAGAFGIYDNNNTAYRMVINSSGNVGIGTTAPGSKLELSTGQFRQTATYNNAASTAIDWNNGNMQYTTASCGAMTFSNMQDGGSYTLIVQGTTTGTCTFSQSSPDSLTGTSFKFSPANGPTINGTQTIYTLIRAGSTVYVSWVAGFQ